jgi:peptidoglycan/LPS O-acetylase OafA/YrhL
VTGDAPPVQDPDASPVGERLSYVGGLDGIRALAVLAVIAYHAGVAHMTGGFLGVDAFFCLSGFLITSLLLGEARRTATIQLGSFWARRARRLLPALLLVICFVGLYSWLGAPSGAYPGLRLDSLATLLYVANWHFVLQGSNYFQQALAPSPLTHTWSLAIEEQFYVVWPLVVLALVKLRRSPRVLLVLSATGAIASSAWMAWLHHEGANLTRLYYGTDTHAMTLLCGATLAAALAVRAGERDVSTLRARGTGSVCVQLVGAAGIVVLAVMAVRVTGTSAWMYEGGFLIAGVAGTGMILSVVTVPRGVLGVVLSFAPVRFVGRISYGLYLWHYPLFIWLDHQRTDLDGVRLFAVRVVVTFGVAIASFYLVERPIRHGLVLRGVGAMVTTATAVAATVALVVATSVAAAVPAAAPQPPQPPFHDPVRALLIGDSTALTLGIALAPWSHLYDVNLDDQAILGCGVTRSDAQIEQGRPIPTNWPCHLTPPPGTTTIYQAWRTDVATFHPDVVAILAGRWEVHTLDVNGTRVSILEPAFQRQVLEGLTVAVHIAASEGAHVVLLTQPCANSGEQSNGQPWPEDSPVRLAIYNHLVREVAHSTGASVLDLDAMACPDGTFQASVDGITIRSADGVHFAKSSGTFLAPRIFSVLLADGRGVKLRGSSPRR